MQNQKTQFRICKNSVPKNFQELSFWPKTQFQAFQKVFQKIFTQNHEKVPEKPQIFGNSGPKIQKLSFPEIHDSQIA